MTVIQDAQEEAQWWKDTGDDVDAAFYAIVVFDLRFIVLVRVPVPR